MNVFCEQADLCTVVKVEGDIAMPDSERFKDFLLQRIENGTSDFILDFSGVPYVDSSGVSALLKLVQLAREEGGDIRLVGLNNRLNKLFEQVGLQHVFQRFESLENGINSYGSVEPAT